MSRFHKLSYKTINVTVDLNRVVACFPDDRDDSDKFTLVIRHDLGQMKFHGDYDDVIAAHESLSDALVGYHHISLEGIKRE